jgi:hypothetical protein
MLKQERLSFVIPPITSIVIVPELSTILIGRDQVISVYEIGTSWLMSQGEMRGPGGSG